LELSNSNENNKFNNSYTNKNEIENENNNKDTNKNKENPIIISPKKIKDSRMTIKPSTIQQEGFFSHKVSHLLDSVKGKTTDHVDKVKVKQQDINSFARTNIQQKENNIPQQEPDQLQFVIPVIEEKYILSKKIVPEDIKIEKRWITHNEKIQVPVSYEKLFVNDKDLDSYSKENIFTHIKDKFLDFVYIEGNDGEENKIENQRKEVINHQKKYQQQTENEKEIQQRKGEKLPLFDEEEKANHNIHTDDYAKMQNDGSQKVISLYAEKIIISKRKVKVGEIIINKRKVTEDKKISFDLMREKITVNYADGRKENIIE
jgi:stress response protein YsnF